LLALKAASSLLRPPDPPPLPPDVGLPRVAVTPAPEPASASHGKRRHAHLGRVASGRGGRLSAEAAEGGASSHMARHPSARSSAKRKPGRPPRRQDPPADAPGPLPEPPPAPTPTPEPPPVPSAPPPGDGSMEFAPH